MSLNPSYTILSGFSCLDGFPLDLLPTVQYALLKFHNQDFRFVLRDTDGKLRVNSIKMTLSLMACVVVSHGSAPDIHNLL